MSETLDNLDTAGLDTVEEFDGEELTVFPGVTGKIYAFLEKADVQDATPTFYLYKYDNYDSGDAKAFIKKFQDCDPPDEDLIGRQYGGGRYLLMLTLPPPRGKRRGITRLYRFRVHPSFTRSDEGTLPVQRLPVFQQPQGNGISEALNMLERIMVMIVPLFNRPRDENIQDILRENYLSMNQVMQSQLQENLSLLTDYQRNIADLGERVNEQGTIPEDDDGPGLMEQFGPLLNQWIPILLGGGPQAKVASAAVQSVPQVRNILQDKIQLRKIIRALDSERGPVETDKLLQVLKIKRPGGSARPVPPPPAAQPAGNVRKRVRRVPVKKAVAGKK